MSNKLTLRRTKFINLDDKHESLGYRVYDEYAQLYNNSMESLPEDDMELLKLILSQSEDNVIEMIDFARETGMFIDSTWHEGSEVAKVFEEWENS